MLLNGSQRIAAVSPTGRSQAISCAGSRPLHGPTSHLPRPSCAACDASAVHPTLALTGERTLPGIPEENYWFRRHEAAYDAVVPFCAGAVVLEAGCGEGYGADRIAASARAVVGIDYDAAAVGHVAAAYPRVDAVRGNLAGLPVRAGVVDVVATLQVIEHLWDQPGFLAECRRVLRPAGTLLVTTPNRLTFSPPNRPLNPFHHRELAPAELRELLTGAGFEVTRLLGLRHGPRLRRLDRLFGSVVDAQLAGPPATWHRELRRAVAGVRTSDFVLAADNLDTCLDLLAVAVRRA
jgi:SAM-dependent methyltransferase